MNHVHQIRVDRNPLPDPLFLQCSLPAAFPAMLFLLAVDLFRFTSLLFRFQHLVCHSVASASSPLPLRGGMLHCVG